MHTRLLGATNAGDRVYVSRVLPFVPEDLVEGPAVVVGVSSERHDKVGQSPTYQTTTTCTVDCYATADDEETLQDTLDDVLDQVEGVLVAGPFRDQFNGITNIQTQSAAEQIEDANILMGRIGTIFDCVYTTQFVPVESRPTFASAHIDFDFDSDVESIVPEA